MDSNSYPYLPNTYELGCDEYVCSPFPQAAMPHHHHEHDSLSCEPFSSSVAVVEHSMKLEDSNGTIAGFGKGSDLLMRSNPPPAPPSAFTPFPISDYTESPSLPGSPPSMTSSSMGSCTESSVFSTPTTSPHSGHSVVSSRRAIAKWKLDVLKDAFAHYPDPTPDECSFLARCLLLHESALMAWRTQPNPGSGPSRRKTTSRNRPVAAWKCKVIGRTLESENPPTCRQVDLLAAGLRITVDQFKKIANDAQEKLCQDGNRPTSLPTLTIELASAHMGCTAHLAASSIKVTANKDGSPVNIKPLHSNTPTNCQYNSDSPLPSSATFEPRPVGFVGVTLPTSPADRHVQRAADPLPSILSREQSADAKSTSGDAHSAASNFSDSDVESSVDKDDDPAGLSLEEEVAEILGPEHAHLAQSIIDTLTSGCFQELLQSTSSSRQYASDSQSPSSTNSDNSQTPGSTSTLITTTSILRSEKRKFSRGDGGDDPDEDDGDKDRQSPKRSRNARAGPRQRYDCPIYRRVVDTGATLQSWKRHDCAPNGLEFRNVWDHLRKTHYGCEVCGKKLDGARADIKHLSERQKDASMCQPSPQEPPPFEIGIDMWLEMAAIYENKELTPDEKWIRWWKMFSPNATDADTPEPHHHDTISISRAEIPKFQTTFHTFWADDRFLPDLDDNQRRIVSNLLEKVFLLMPVVHRKRRPRSQPQTQRSSVGLEAATPVAMQAVPEPKKDAGNTNPEPPSGLYYDDFPLPGFNWVLPD